jgi:hypothetical protein
MLIVFVQRVLIIVLVLPQHIQRSSGAMAETYQRKCQRWLSLFLDVEFPPIHTALVAILQDHLPDSRPKKLQSPSRKQ